MTSRSPKWQSVTTCPSAVSLFTIYPTWHTTCRSSGHSNSIHQLRWRPDIANICNRLTGTQTATRYWLNASANKIFCQERTAISQTTRRKLAASYDRAYYKLWSPISRFRLRRRSVCFNKVRLILLVVLQRTRTTYLHFATRELAWYLRFLAITSLVIVNLNQQNASLGEPQAKQIYSASDTHAYENSPTLPPPPPSHTPKASRWMLLTFRTLPIVHEVEKNYLSMQVSFFNYF